MAQNKHLDHIEDLILDEGYSGGETAIKMLNEVGEYLTGKPSIKITTKFDGAPAIVCGTDPSDGRFFVGTKSVFNKENPKIAKSEDDIREMYSTGPGDKLLECFRHLSKCNIRGVIQGDLMFGFNDKKSTKINGISYITFRPNTITYAVPKDTPLGKKIASSQLGIVFHTKYLGSEISMMSAGFNVSKNDWTSTPSVWAQTSEYDDVTKDVMMTSSEKSAYDAAVRRAHGSIKQCRSLLNKIQSGKKTLAIDTEFKKFFNNYVKSGSSIPSVERAYREFTHHLGKEYDKQIKKNKTLKTQAEKAARFIDTIDLIEQKQREFKMIIASYMNIQFAKQILLNKLKKTSRMRQFIQRGDDFEVTSDEGYVAISGDKAIKLVDRLEFSRLNFTLPKSW